MSRRLIFLNPPPLIRLILNPALWGWLILAMMIGIIWGLYDLV